MKVFFDTEFTGLHKDTTLISIGMISEDHRTFYAELTDYDESQVDDWIRDNIISNLKFISNFDEGANSKIEYKSLGNKQHVTVWGNSKEVASKLKKWLESFDETVEMWSDCLAYDWVLFCNLFGHAFNVPECVYYIPFDICTLFKMKGINPDINREEYAYTLDDTVTNIPNKHNALWDAYVIRTCYLRLIDQI